MHVALLSSDLMLVAAAQGAADRHGVSLAVAASAEALVEACGDNATRLAVIDLRTPGLAVGEVVPRLRRCLPEGALVAACGPHVHKESLAAAAAAGCDEVITRGEFERRFDALVAQLTGPGATGAGPGR